MTASLPVVRVVAGYGAIVSALPYLALKVIWLGGGTLGVADTKTMSEASMVALNAVTAGMDLVAIGIALAFTHRWGQRMAAWAVLPPMWVATGLLVKFVLAMPLVAVASALSPRSPARDVRGPVEPWVYVVVYTAFVGLGVGLIAAFVLYAKARWGGALRGSVQAFPPGPTRSVQVPLANAAALMAIAVAVFHLSSAAAPRSMTGALLDGVDAALALGAALGVLVIVHRIGPRIPFWLPLAVTWVSAGALFAWGLWPLVNVLGHTALVRDRPPEMALVNYVSLLKLLSGLIAGLVMLFLLSERQTPSHTLE